MAAEKDPMFIDMRHRLRFLIPLFWMVMASAQQPAPALTPSNPQIQLDVVVTSKNGDTFASELRQEDFTVLDNKVAQPITSFKAVGGNEVPTDVILVIDAVNSSYSTIAYERNEIAKFLRANGGHLDHPTALAIVTDKGIQIQDNFSTDGNAMSEALAHQAIGLRELRRSAGFYGAEDRFQLFVKAFKALTAREASRPGRKLILWISPQWPLLSGPAVTPSKKEQQGLFSAIVDFSTELRQARVTLYSIDPLGVEEGLGRADFYRAFLNGVTKPGQTQAGDLGLQVLAIQSGGQAFNSTGVAASLRKCTDDTKSYYELTFESHPTAETNEYHSVDVKVATSGLVARGREGYYSHPDFPEAGTEEHPYVTPIQSGRGAN